MGTQATLTPSELRALIREGKFTTPTSGYCPGYLQANLVILHQDIAKDFEEFCKNNAQACPLMTVLKPGEREPKDIAVGADIARDVPKYRIWRYGQLVEERTDVSELWNENLVSFFLGCSFGFEKALMDAGVPVRNIEQKKNVSMYTTNIPCVSAGPFSTQLVVSYRPVPEHLVKTAFKVTEEFGESHGRPVHSGDPSKIGIKDLNKPDFGDAVEQKEGDVPVFWACGVTSTMAAISAKSPLVITHSPGHMFVTDKLGPQH